MALHPQQTIDERGFTLLEILLVIVMIAVTSAMVVPSLYQSTFGSAEEVSQRLRVVMRAALEESQMTGLPIRWVATEQNWYFEALAQTAPDKSAEWVGYAESPFETYDLPEGIMLTRVEQVGDFVLDMGEQSNDGQQAVVIGIVLLLPDGTTSQSDVYFAEEKEAYAKFLRIRPGPAGIQIQDNLN
ncbi:MAG: type II secretion system protein GspH [Zetaproteobacteria bacterium CG2_30_46_52]|nr:MAG: type II secretion system protein GspH [Zetaproteobacteria bacterium CG2_30_46_52]